MLKKNKNIIRVFIYLLLQTLRKVSVGKRKGFTLYELKLYNQERLCALANPGNLHNL